MMNDKNYQQRVNKVLEYIDSHIDESLTTTQLCEVANFSQYHFHRLFSAFVGMPMIKYIQYIKLKRAAYQLMWQKQRKIIAIALDAGFDSHEAFSRAFKKACGLSPSSFRKTPNWLAWQFKPYKTQRGNTMNVEIKTIPSIRTALIEHHGNFTLINETAAKLVAWSEKNKLPMKNSECYGLIYNDPETTPEDEFRFDFCMQVSKSTKIVDDVIHEYIIPGGRYAIARHLGSHDTLGDTVRTLYRDWLPKSDEELRDVPSMFQYHNFAHDVQESALITDVCLPLK